VGFSLYFGMVGGWGKRLDFQLQAVPDNVRPLESLSNGMIE